MDPFSFVWKKNAAAAKRRHFVERNFRASHLRAVNSTLENSFRRVPALLARCLDSARSLIKKISLLSFTQRAVSEKLKYEAKLIFGTGAYLQYVTVAKMSFNEVI